MKIFFQNAEALLGGIQEVAAELDFTLADKEQAELTVSVCAVDERILHVTREGKTATITYGDGYARFFRALAILIGKSREGEQRFDLTERPLFETNGAMVDMSRNAVMNLPTLYAMLRKMALMGLNTYQLYVEDTYELSDYPYFGYMRGRYTREELCAIDRYARMLGIEMIPCIQVLGHLTTHLRWAKAGAYRDTASALLVGADETYRLIESMIKTVSECFATRRIHIGMDETHDLGTGAYLDRFGYRERQEIYFAHLERVSEILQKYGMQPMMWSDMFFRLAGKDIPGYEDYCLDVTFTEEYINSVPKHIKQVYWDYYHDDEHFYATNIDKHRLLFGENMMFAGGVWLWSGHCPMYSESLRNSVPALKACRQKGVRDVLATVWLNGSENHLMLSLAGLAWYADFDYRGDFDLLGVKRCFSYACQADYDDLMLCELPEHPHGDRFTVTRVLLYNDPMLGLPDRHFEGLDLREYYRNATRALAGAEERGGIFADGINVVCKLSSLLENKADFGLRLWAAYEQNDRAALASLAKECDVIIEKLTDLRMSHRTAWMNAYKPFGWEVHDIRYGGLLARFDTVRETINAYLGGAIDRIAELEEARLRFDGKADDAAPIDDRFFWMTYTALATAGTLR